MSAEIIDTTGGILLFKVAGRVTQAEFAAVQQQAAEIIQQQGKVRFLVMAEDFAGFDKGGDWGDVSFQAKYDPFIEKIAIVGDKRWEDLALLFTGKGVRRVPIEYFAPAELSQAKAWLAA